MIAPPQGVLEFTEAMARRSSCAKSKRGAAVFSHSGFSFEIYGAGCNGQPEPLACTGTARCRELCGKLCEHAEGRAIRQAAGSVFVTSGRALSDNDCDLVHVKIGEDGRIVAGGPPSCWQCSRAILDCGFIAGVWLYEMSDWLGLRIPLPDGPPFWRRYTAGEFHLTTLKNCDMEV